MYKYVSAKRKIFILEIVPTAFHFNAFEPQPLKETKSKYRHPIYEKR